MTKSGGAGMTHGGVARAARALLLLFGVALAGLAGPSAWQPVQAQEVRNSYAVAPFCRVNARHGSGSLTFLEVENAATGTYTYAGGYITRIIHRQWSEGLAGVA